MHGAFRRVARVHLDQGDHREGSEGEQFDGQQQELQSRRDLDTPVTDVGQRGDPHGADERRPEGARGQALRPEEQEAVLPGDLRQVRHHHDVGDDEAPAAHPADAGTERAGGPGEGRSAVGIGLVELPVGVGDAEHGHEGDQQHDGRLQSDRRGDEPDGRGEAVTGRCRGHADDDAGQQTQSPGLEALVLRRGQRYCHGDSFQTE